MKHAYIKDVSRDITQLTFADFYTRLSLLARAVFRWEGLPPTIKEKYIEKYLFSEGYCLFFKDFEKGWMVAKCTMSGDLNYYDEPTKVTPVATGYNGEDLTNGDGCVLIYNNDKAAPTYDTIILYAARLTEIQRTADINIIAQKTPVIVTGSEKQKLSLKAVIRSWLGNEPIIHGDKAMEGTELRTLNTSAPVVFDKLTIEKNKLWNECMTFLGINNANLDKRERLVDDEVQANNEQIQLSADVMLKARQEAAEAISALIGSKVTVTMRTPEEVRRRLQTGAEEDDKND